MNRKIVLLSVVIVLLLVPIFCYSQIESVKVTKIGEWNPDNYNHMAVQGNYAYCSIYNGGMDIFDIGARSKPVKTGHYGMSGVMEDINVSGNYVVAAKGKSLYILNISDPKKPLKVGTYTANGVIKRIALSGNYAYIVTQIDPLQDASSCGYSTDFEIIDISNASNPRRKSFIRTEKTQPGKIRVSGNYAYIIGIDCSSTMYYSLRVIDIKNPLFPVLKSNINLGPAPHAGALLGVALSGDYLYFTSSSSDFKIIDVSDPSNPAPVPCAYKTQIIYGVAAIGHYIYLNDFYRGLVVLDISNPSSIVEVGLFAFKHRGKIECSSGNFIYQVGTVEKPGGFEIIDASDPIHPKFSCSYYMPNLNSFGNISISGNYAYIADGDKGLEILDISNPSKPVMTGIYSTEGEYASNVKISGNYAYLSYLGLFKVIDISDKFNPVLVGSYNLGRIVALTGDYLVTAMSNELEMWIIDMSDKSNPKHVGTYIPEPDLRHLGNVRENVVSGNYIYRIFTGYDYIAMLEVIDISDKTDPHRVASFPIGEAYSYDIAISGNYLYITTGYYRFQVIDISNPLSPVAAGSYYCHSIFFNIYSLFVSGNYAVTSGHQNGHLFDISNPLKPILACIDAALPKDGGFFIDGDKIYAPSKQEITGRIDILKISPNTETKINVFGPASGDQRFRGTAESEIMWIEMGLTGDLMIDLYKGNKFCTHIGSAPVEAGKYIWKIPTGLKLGNDYRVCAFQGNIRGFSNYFSIDTLNIPVFEIDREKLTFGSVNGWTTPPQTVKIDNYGRGVLTWTVSATETWIDFTPVSGSDDGSIRVGVNPAGLAEGTYSGSIKISTPYDEGYSFSPRSIAVTLNVKNTGSGPIGEISTPIEYATVNGSVPVTGWTLDDVGVSSVKIYRDAKIGEAPRLYYLGTADFVEGARPDVEANYSDYPNANRAGWGYMALTHFLPDGGNGPYTFYAVATDIEGNQKILGSKDVTISNSQSVKPFGAIDTPAPGEITGGNSYKVFGWALTPMPNMIPIDGSTITVWFDGAPLGNPTYNQYRKDIAELFPGYANATGAVGYFKLNTTFYPDGVHTLSWSVKDNAGNEEGIGSRYFTIQNPGNSVSGVQSSKISAGDSELAVDFSDPVSVKKGFNKEINAEDIYPDENGVIHIRIKELERVEIRMTPGTENLSKLPIGSNLDRKQGVFTWAPGPGFVGEYRFVFAVKENTGIMKKKTIKILVQ